MFTTKIIATVGLAAAMLLGLNTDASANPWRGGFYRPVPVYRPVVRPVYAPPVYQAPVVVYGPTYAPPVYRTPVFVPAYRPVGWHHGWGWHHGRRW